MNWFTKRNFGIVTDEMDHCEHLAVGDKYHRMDQENDSFGIVGQYASCEACCDAADAAAAEELGYCADCKQQKPMGQIRQWRWYDFYAPQGDTPRHVCKECWEKPQHQRRMAKDQADYRAEMGHGDHDDDDEYY